MSAEAKAVGQRGVYGHITSALGAVVKIAFGVGYFIADSLVHIVVLDGKSRNYGFNGSPAAPRRCPVMDLVELITTFLAVSSPSAFFTAFVSYLSLRPVDVP